MKTKATLRVRPARPVRVRALPPNKRKRDANDLRNELVKVERDNRSHLLLEQAIVNAFAANKIKLLTNRHIDLLARVGPVSVIFEVKACSPMDIGRPLSQAVIQLLEYRYHYRNTLEPDIRLCIVSERRPRGGLEWLIGFFEHLNIGIIWKNDGDNELSCNEFTKRLLEDVLPGIKTWIPKPILWK